MSGFRRGGQSESHESGKRPDAPAPLDFEELFRELWTACQPFVNAVATLREDKELGDSNGEDIYPVGSAGYGKEFAVFRARRRLAFDDFQEFRDVSEKIRKKKIAHNNTIDKRGKR